MFDDLAQELVPFTGEDSEGWSQFRSRYEGRSRLDVFWYPGPGFDLSPLQAKSEGRLRNALLVDVPVVYSDGHPACRGALEGACELFREGHSSLRQLEPALRYMHGADGLVEVMLLLRRRAGDEPEAAYIRLSIGGPSFDLLYLFRSPLQMLREVFSKHGIGLMTVAPLGSHRGGVWDVDFAELPLACIAELGEPLAPEFVLTNQTFDFNPGFRKRFKYCSLIRDLSMGRAQLYRRRRPRTHSEPAACG